MPNRTAGEIAKAIFLAIVYFIGAIIGCTFAAFLIGDVIRATGIIHGEAGEWFGLTAAGLGFMAGIAVGLALSWRRIARGFEVSPRVIARGTILLLLLVPMTEYLLLKWPRMTGPSTDNRPVIDAVSNDGGTVILDLSGTNSSVLYRVDTRSGQATPLTAPQNGLQEGAAISPDGKLVAFVSSAQRGASTIMVCKMDGTDLHPLLANAGNDFAPNFSPDGRSIIFARLSSPDRDRRFEMYSTDLDGSSVKQLTHRSFGAENDVTYSFYPVGLSHDGSLVLMKWDTRSGDRLLAYRLYDEDRAALEVTPDIPSSPKYAIIVSAYFAAGDKELWLMAASNSSKGFTYDIYRKALDSPKLERVTSNDSYASDFRLSADGNTGAFFTWEKSYLNRVPIHPALHLLDVKTQAITDVGITGLPN